MATGEAKLSKFDESIQDNMDVEQLKAASVLNVEPKPVVSQTSSEPEVFSAISPRRRLLILCIVTVGGFLGPLSGGIYLPALPVLEREFRSSSVAMNATVSVFMVVSAVGVSASRYIRIHVVVGSVIRVLTTNI